MSINNVGSIFNLSYNDIEVFTPRLKPQEENTQSLYGCLSVSGFLAYDEELLERGLIDLKVVESKQVSFQTIARKVEYLFLSAMNGCGVIDGKFKVTLHSATTSQFCPFSSRTDVNIHTFNTENGACGESNIDFVIENINLKRSIYLNELNIHLIRDHHFFEGNVPFRVNPLSLIEILELKPEMPSSKTINFNR